MLESRAVGCDSETLAKDMLGGFVEVCMRAGLDGVLVELSKAVPDLDVTDGAALADDPRFRPALAARLDNKAEFDSGGPRNAKPRQLAEGLIATLGLTLTDEPDRTITLTDDVRAQVLAALTAVAEVELAAAPMRDAIVAQARAKCEERFLVSFDKIAAQLDERAMRMLRQPKVPLDAVQAVQQARFDARNAVIAKAAHAAIERATPVLGRASAEAATRIGQPITHKLTPRDVAIRRVNDSRVPKVPAAVAHSLFESLTELCHLVWRPLDRPVRTYGASQTFVVGDLVEHPKFGRGSVLSADHQRIEVEFPEGKYTLVHARK
ncbi:hypothetical protein BH11MYX3_BH11MYX3_36240 [soil metagenome]